MLVSPAPLLDCMRNFSPLAKLTAALKGEIEMRYIEGMNGEGSILDKGTKNGVLRRHLSQSEGTYPPKLGKATVHC